MSAEARARQAGRDRDAQLAPVNTALGNLGLNPIRFPVPTCRLDGCDKAPRERSPFCSDKHRQAHPWIVWDPAEYDPEDDPFGVRKCARVIGPVRWRKSIWVEERECWMQDAWKLTNQYPVHLPLVWEYKLAEHIPSVVHVEWIAEGADEVHANDRWPDWPVCSRCQPVIPVAAQAAMLHDPVFVAEVGERAASFARDRKTAERRGGWHTSAKHADGMTVADQRGAARRSLRGVEAAQFTDVDNRERHAEILRLGRESLAENDGNGRQRFGAERFGTYSIEAGQEEYGREPEADATGRRPKAANEEALEVAIGLFLDKLTEPQRQAVELIHWQRYSFAAAGEQVFPEKSAAAAKSAFQSRYGGAKAALLRLLTGAVESDEAAAS